MELSVIVPCLDEEACLANLLDRLEAVFDAGPAPGWAEAVFVDDGSTDATWAILERASKTRGFVVAARHHQNQGLPAAWRTGLERSAGRLVCLLDADLQYRPEDIPRLLRAFEASGADLVQGARSARFRNGGSRYVVSRGLCLMLNAIFGMDLTDNKSGFILCRREVLVDLLSYRGHYTYWQILLLVAAHIKGYRIHEVESAFDARYGGRSFLADVPLRPIARAAIDVLRGVAEYKFGL